MSKLRLLLVTAAAALSLSAVLASSAFAYTEFVGKEGIGTTVTSRSAVEPTFVATGEGGKTVTVKCKSDSGSGTLASSSVVETKLTFSECKNGAGNKVTVTNGCEFDLNIDDAVSLPSGCEVKVEAKTTGCILKIAGGQTATDGVEYANTGSFTGEVKSHAKVTYTTSTAKKCLLSESTESLEDTSEYTGTDDSEGVEVN